MNEVEEVGGSDIVKNAKNKMHEIFAYVKFIVSNDLNSDYGSER